MTEERAWLDMGAEYLRHDSMAGVGVTPDDRDEVADDDAPDDPEPRTVWPVGCDGQCGTLLFVDSDGEPEPDALYFCSEACRMWYESPDPEPAEGVDGAQGERRVLPLDGAMVDVPF